MIIPSSALTRCCIVTLSIVICLSTAKAQDLDQPVTRFTDLPDEIKKEILIGSPRRSKDIPESPFGTHTTVMSEACVDRDQLVPLLSEAGFKWVMDYVSNGDIDKLSDEQIVKKAKLPPFALDYAAKLQSAGIHLLMRIDMIPYARSKALTQPGHPTAEELSKMELYQREVVAQLKPYVRHWQYFNEPNIGGRDPIALPENYAKTIAHLSASLRKQQPDAVIYGPGTAMLQCMAEKPYPWIPNVLKAGLLNSIDVFSFHPYRQPYTRNNLPENSSEFLPWEIWGDYEKQISDLRRMLKDIGGKSDFPLATSEDGIPAFIDPEGIQNITWPVAAKYELRKMLLDFGLGISPRIHFCFYREMPDDTYESEASFNMIYFGKREIVKKPIFYAAQNLMAVLDSTYQKEPAIRASFIPDDTKKLDPAKIRTQIYSKSSPKFDELLVFYWAAIEGNSQPQKFSGKLKISGGTWQAPLKIDLMSMPAPRSLSGEMAQLINPEYRNRLQPEAIKATSSGDTVLTESVALKDYPMLIKFFRLKH